VIPRFSFAIQYRSQSPPYYGGDFLLFALPGGCSGENAEDKNEETAAPNKKIFLENHELSQTALDIKVYATKQTPRCVP
jgi:hypothetical protein